MNISSHRHTELESQTSRHWRLSHGSGQTCRSIFWPRGSNVDEESFIVIVRTVQTFPVQLCFVCSPPLHHGPLLHHPAALVLLKLTGREGERRCGGGGLTRVGCRREGLALRAALKLDAVKRRVASRLGVVSVEHFEHQLRIISAKVK